VKQFQMVVRLDDIIEKVLSHNPDADLQAIQQVYIYTAKMHEGQMRRSGEPYLTHPLGVALIIADMAMDIPSVCAAMLHDVVEDTSATIEDIKKLAGDEVAFLVEGVTNLSKSEYRFSGKTEQQAENFRKMLVAVARDIRVLVLKLADRLHNMRTLDHMPEEKRIIKARETLEIYAPLSNRLGMETVKAELEDLSFKHLAPDEYEDLSKKLSKTRREREKYIELASHTISNLMAEENLEASVQGRIKHIYSIYKKMKEQNLEFENIYDVLAFRVITDSMAHCYQALGIIHAHYTPVPERVKDYIAMPKANSYKSLHTTVIGPEQNRIEIQIRTRDMHRIAEFGIAAHWLYKDQNLSEEDEVQFSWLRELMDRQKEVSDPKEFIETVKIDLFQEDVYVFTPAGKLLTFPAGSTPVDFAYAIHTEVGHQCTGARVNGVLVPLKYQLQNGDWVEIITSKNHKPSKDWMNIVVTGRAKQKIRNFIRSEERLRSRQIGRDLLDREFRRMGLSYSKLEKKGEMKKVAEACKLGSVEELLSAVGYGRISKTQIISNLEETTEDLDHRREIQETKIDRIIHRALGGHDGIRVGGMENILIRFGKCCNPVYGDKIIGFITRGRGVTIHHQNCDKTRDLDPERRVEVQWDSKSAKPRPVSIRVTTWDRPGTLAAITKVLVDRKINLKNANAYAIEDDQAVHIYTFDVKNTEQLQAVVTAIESIKGVQSVERLMSLSMVKKQPS